MQVLAAQRTGGMASCLLVVCPMKERAAFLGQALVIATMFAGCSTPHRSSTPSNSASVPGRNKDHGAEAAPVAGSALPLGANSRSDTSCSGRSGIVRAGLVPGAETSEFSIWRSVGAIIFVLGGLLAANGFLKKRQGLCAARGSSRSIRLVERLAIDPRRSLLLVEAEGQRILLGTAGEGIEPLAVLGPAPEQRTDGADANPNGEDNA